MAHASAVRLIGSEFPAAQLEPAADSVPTARDRLIVALDQQSKEESLKLVNDLDEHVTFYKVAWVALLTGGVELLQTLLERQKKIFLDFKIFDVPNTVKQAVRAAAIAGVRFVTVHGIAENIKMAILGREEAGRGFPKILAVTALTSLSERDVRQLYGLPDDVTLEDHVVRKAIELVGHGCDGVIASPQEVARIRQEFPEKVLIVAPGIRMEGESTDDHKRPGHPYDSIKSGADYLVVGRSIYGEADPVAKAESYVEEIARGLKDRA